MRNNHLLINRCMQIDKETRAKMEGTGAPAALEWVYRELKTDIRKEQEWQGIPIFVPKIHRTVPNLLKVLQ